MVKKKEKKCKSPLRKMADGGLFDSSPPFLRGLRGLFGTGTTAPARMAVNTIGIRG